MADENMPQATESKSFFKKASPDAWLIAGSIMLASIFLVAVNQPGVFTQTAPSATAPTANQPAQPDAPTQAGVVSVDDDPVIGNPDAPVTIVEFSDYECPFCKQFFTATLPQIKKQYIDTGKVKMVFRDFPLPFHDPMSTKESVAANCVRAQGNDEAYFKMHDLMFTKTTSNGTGLTDADVTAMAKSLNMDMTKFGACLQDPAQTAEIKKDITDGDAAGVTGTPSFVIGASSKDGKINGQLVVGAQPLAAFQAVIDPLLK